MITSEQLIQHWNDFFFQPIHVHTIAEFRIIFGIVLLLDVIYVLFNIKEYLGVKGLISYERYHKRNVGKALSLFLYFPPTMTSTYVIISLHIIFICMMILGIVTPISIILTYITLLSIVNRNPTICNGGDNVARTMCFLLVFAYSGHTYSFDEYFFYQKFIPNKEYLMISPWAIRLMQIQVSIIYLYTFYWKLKGITYRNGTAMYYVMGNTTYRRFQLPKFLLEKPFVHILTWGALLIEFALPFGLWIADFQYEFIILGFLLHIAIEYMLNVHFFSFYMMVSLLLFINPDDMARFVENVVTRFG